MIVVMPSAVCRTLLSSVAKDGTRYAMDGILIQAIGARIYFVSSDAHRMAVYSPSLESTEAEERVQFGEHTVPQRDTGGEPMKDAKGRPLFQDVHGRIITTKAFAARVQKSGRHCAWSGVRIDLESLRDAECIDGQFPRWCEVWPSSEAICAVSYAKGTVQFIPELCVNIRYLLDGEDMIEHCGKNGLLQTKEGSPLFCETGDRPWMVQSKQTEGDYAGMLIMPAARVKDVLLQGHQRQPQSTIPPERAMSEKPHRSMIPQERAKV